jgi:siroheme synthase-like protein
LADLLAVGARVKVIEPKRDPYLTDLANKGAITLENQFEEGFLDARPWVFVAVDDPAEAKAISAMASARGLMVNVADRPGECGFIMPALVDDPPFRVAVSTGGNSPALSARVARELRLAYAGYGALAALLGRLRPLIMNSGLGPGERKSMFKALAEDRSLAGLLAGGDAAALREALRKRLDPVEVPPGFPLT